MNIEDLTKTQLLMLTLLVNFVTSIATGVLTVSLLTESSPTVTQAVTQVIDRTIETVAPENPDNRPVVAAPIIVPAKPSATTEELLTSAIAVSSARDVTISNSRGPIASGVFLPDSRTIVTVSSQSLPREAQITFADGTTAEASRVRVGTNLTLYGLADDAALPAVSTPKLVDFASLKAGQTVIGLTSDNRAVTGIISKLDETGIYTNLQPTPAGSAVVNLSGDIIGISSGTAGVLVSVDNIASLLASEAAE